MIKTKPLVLNKTLARALHYKVKTKHILPAPIKPIKVNDVFYIKEKWHVYDKLSTTGEPIQTLGYQTNITCHEDMVTPWKPATHMPKRAARYLIQVTAITSLPLHELTESMIKDCGYDNLYQLKTNWDLEHKDLPYDENPTVIIISFNLFEKDKTYQLNQTT